MWRRYGLIALLAVTLTGCFDTSAMYIPGSEQYAHELCAPNGGLKKLHVSTIIESLNRTQTKLEIKCNDNNIQATVFLDGTFTSLDHYTKRAK